MIQKSDTIGELAKALCKVQSVIESAKKDAENPFFKSHYADLSAVWDVARKPLTDNGLSVSQLPGACDGSKIKIHTMLMHSSGEWIASDLEMPYIKSDPQAVGSAITYGRRYALAAVIGIVADVDDDAEGAVGDRKKGNTPTPPPKTQPGASESKPQANGFTPKKHDDLDQRQMQVAIDRMLTEMYGEDAVTQLERLTSFTGKDGNKVVGKRNVYEVAIKPNANGETFTSLTYIKVRAEYAKWEAGQKEASGELV
jgi:hypothetical protein